MADRTRDQTAETTSRRPAPAGPWAVLCLAESRAYLLRVCGPDVSAAAVDGALAAVAGLIGQGAGPPGPEAVETIRRTLRDAALDQVVQSAHRPAARLRRLSGPHVRCRRVPDLLRQRATGGLSATELRYLYGRLDRCPECAGLTGRLDAAEWTLRHALGRAAHPDGNTGAPGPETAGATGAPGPTTTGSEAVRANAARAVETGAEPTGPEAATDTPAEPTGAEAAAEAAAPEPSADEAAADARPEPTGPPVSAPEEAPIDAPVRAAPEPTRPFVPETVASVPASSEPPAPRPPSTPAADSTPAGADPTPKTKRLPIHGARASAPEATADPAPKTKRPPTETPGPETSVPEAIGADPAPRPKRPPTDTPDPETATPNAGRASRRGRAPGRPGGAAGPTPKPGSATPRPGSPTPRPGSPTPRPGSPTPRPDSASPRRRRTAPAVPAATKPPTPLTGATRGQKVRPDRPARRRRGRPLAVVAVLLLVYIGVVVYVAVPLVTGGTGKKQSSGSITPISRHPLKSVPVGPSAPAGGAVTGVQDITGVPGDLLIVGATPPGQFGQPTSTTASTSTDVTTDTGLADVSLIGAPVAGLFPGQSLNG